MRTLQDWILASLRAAGFAPIAAFLLHIFLSKVLGSYGAIPNLDIPMHFLGGFAIAFFFWRSVSCSEAEPVLGQLTSFGRFLLALTALGATTVLWEFAEWSGDRLGLTHAQAGLDDTMFDMFVGICGGLCWLIAAHRRAR